MLGSRILVVIADIPDADALAATVLETVARASHPFAIRFAIPAYFQDIGDAVSEEAFQKIVSTAVFYPEAEGAAGVLPFIKDETHFLFLQGAHGFSERWDQGLLSRFSRLPSPNAVMTGAVSAPVPARGEGLPSPMPGALQASQMPTVPQAFLPAVGHVFGEPGVQLVHGVPVVCGAAPIKTMLINPSIVFGKLDFLHQTEAAPGLLSISAFVAGFHVYALESPLLWPLEPPGPRWLQRPDEETLPRANLARFEHLAGFSFELRRVGVRAALGLFGEVYPQQMPLSLAVSQKAKALMARATHPMPMVVTAFCELPDSPRPALWYTLRFSYLRSLAHVPLLLYAGGPQERTLRGAFPNTFSYPDNSLLPKSLIYEGMPPMEHFKRNKMPLLQRAMQTYAGFDHYVWVDMDTLPYPICPQAMPDFSGLLDDSIHLATADGEPDGSLIVVPRQHMKLMVREVNALSQVDAALKRSFTERAMLKRLIEKFPDIITLHPMPRTHFMLMSLFDPGLLSERDKAMLRDIQPPLRGRTANVKGARKL